jgi:hypothetical protein
VVVVEGMGRGEEEGMGRGEEEGMGRGEEEVRGTVVGVEEQV